MDPRTSGRAPAYDLEICPAGEAADVLARGKTADFLSAAEEARLAFLQTPKRRRDWLAGRIAAKRALGRAFAETSGARRGPREIELSNDEAGGPLCVRPAVAPPFSISHAEGGGLCAVLRGPGRVGTDWERVAGRGPGFLKLFAHPSERTTELEASPEAQTRLWTLKEAVLKLLGVGLACPPTDVRWRGSLELHGGARGVWLELGSPRIVFEHGLRDSTMICVAYGSPGGRGKPRWT